MVVQGGGRGRSSTLQNLSKPDIFMCAYRRKAKLPKGSEGNVGDGRTGIACAVSPFEESKFRYLRPLEVNIVNGKSVAQELSEIVRKYGPYSASNMRLAEGVYTINEKANYDHFKLNRIKQLVADLGYLRPGIRLLDIASLESMFANEFALEGLEVVSIEGRESNIERGKFAARVLGANNIGFYMDDVNNISEEKYGRFDVILCMGILYHIAKDKYLDFLKNVTACCKDVLIVDTFTSLHENEYVERDGIRYTGTTWREFGDNVSQEDREKHVHSALSNSLSFSMTKPALIEYLQTLGFTTITEVYTPRQPGQPADRPTLVCFRGKSLSMRVFPEFDYHRDFASATDTRGTKGLDLVFWNLPRNKQRAAAIRHKIAVMLRSILPEKSVRRIRRLVHRGPGR